MQVAFRPFQPLKVSKCHLSCRFYLPTITSIQRYLKTQSLYGMLVFCHPSLMYRLIRFLHALPARRAASLPDSRAASLADYFHRPACFLYRLHTVRAAFSKRSSRRSRDVIPVRFGSRLPTAHVHVCRLRSPHRRIVSCGRAVFPPSIPPRRPDIAAARLSRRMAPRGAGRASLTCQFGADRHGS